MKPSTEIKYSAGDKVYWLSSKGFQKGIVKQVILTDFVSISSKKMTKRKEIKFLLWSENYAEVYMGDEVKENEIFSSYEEMVNYYSSIKNFKQTTMSTKKKYKLLKDTVDGSRVTPEGTFLYEDGNVYRCYATETIWSKGIVENNPEWFSEVKEEVPFTWDGTDEGFLDYLIKQKIDAVDRCDYEAGSRWREIEKLYRKYLLEKVVQEKPKGNLMSLKDVVENYIKTKSNESWKPIDTKEDINQMKLHNWGKDGYIVDTMEEHRPKPDTKEEKAERIEVEIGYNTFTDMGIYVDFKRTIAPKEKFPAIKEAIEKVLNNDK